MKLLFLSLLALCLLFYPAKNVQAEDTVCQNPPNPVVAENCQPGTRDWHITQLLGDIEGYASATSVSPQEKIDFLVNTDAPAFDLYIYRSGYYGGKGGRLVQTAKGIKGIVQPDCHFNRNTGLVSCSNWSSTYDLTIPEDWVSGVYIAKLVRPDSGGENYILFVVRNISDNSDILFQQSVTTYQAYNFYGNKCLYSSISWDYCPTISGTSRAVKVSFDRPNAITPAYQNSYFWTDYPVVYWLEKQGYDVSYSTNLDTHQSGKPGGPNELVNHRVFLSVGHDEYWTQEMRDAITAARDAGVHLGFFSSNASYWRIRLEPDPWSGQPDRVVVTYKTTESGPPDPSGHPTTTWRDPEGANDPENALIGIQYVGDNDVRYFPLRVTAEQAQDKIYRNTGLQEMSTGTYFDIGKHLFGWEWDSMEDNGKTPENLTILATSPVYGELLLDAGRKYWYGTAQALTTRYTASSGAIVFASGTNQWGWGLAIYEPDRTIQQITYNLLADMGIQPATPVASLTLDGESYISDEATIVEEDSEEERDTILIRGIENLLKEWATGDFKVSTSETSLPSGEGTFLPLEEGSAPEISNLKVEASYDTAVFTWETDVLADGQLWVKFSPGPIDFRLSGETPGVRPIAAEAAHESFRKDHKLVVTGLLPDTNYYYQIASADPTRRTMITLEQSFQTRAGGPVSLRLKGALRPVYRQLRCWCSANVVLVIGILVVILFTLSLMVVRLAYARRLRTQGSR